MMTSSDARFVCGAMLLMLSVAPVCLAGAAGMAAGAVLAGVALAVLIRHWEPI